MARFFQITCEEVDLLRDSELTKNGLIAFLYLRSIEAFGDSYRPMPTKRELAEYLRVSIATVRRILKKLKFLGLFIFDVRDRFKSVFVNVKRVGTRVRDKFFCPDRDCKKSDKTDLTRSRLQKSDRDCKNKQPEPLPDKTCDSPQTLQTNSDLPDGGQVDEEIKEEKPEVKVNKSVGVDREKYNVLPGHKSDRVKINLAQDVTQKNEDIPEDLLKRLQEREIPLTEQIKVAIASHDISQAYGAVTWVENTWETIRDPKGVFLYQLPKQPVERLGQLYPDDNLEKQKRENEAIELEIKQDRPSISSVPAYSRWSKIKENLVKKNTSPEGHD